MKLKEGKFYILADGKKIGPLEKTGSGKRFTVLGPYLWDIEGKDFFFWKPGYN